VGFAATFLRKNLIVIYAITEKRAATPVLTKKFSSFLRIEMVRIKFPSRRFRIRTMSDLFIRHYLAQSGSGY